MKNKMEYHSLMSDSELFKSYEEENFKSIEELLIVDTEMSKDGMICFKFHHNKFYSTDRMGEPKVFLGSADRRMMPCVSPTTENVERVRNILESQQCSYLEHIDKNIIYDIFKKNSLMIGIPSFLLAIITFILTKSPLLLISLIVGGSCLNVYSCRKDYKKDNTKVVLPLVKFNNNYDEWLENRERETREYQEKYEAFKRYLPSVKVKNKVLQKVLKHKR